MEQPNPNQGVVASKYGKFIALVIGVILIGAGIFMYFRTGELARVCTEGATATVVNMREDFTTDTDAEGARYIYYPVIEYSANGQTVKGELSSGSNPPAYSVNDTIEILYNPDKIEEFIVVGENQNIVWIVLGGLGIVFVGVGIYLFIKK